MKDLWDNVVIIMFLCFLCGKWQNPASCGKSGIMSMKTYNSRLHPPTQPKKTLSVSNIPFFQEQGKRASLPGCDLSDIRQCCRPVPSRAEKQNSPCLPWAQCNSQHSWSMSWTEPLEHACQPMISAQGRGRRGGKAQKKRKKKKKSRQMVLTLFI